MPLFDPPKCSNDSIDAVLRSTEARDGTAEVDASRHRSAALHGGSRCITASKRGAARPKSSHGSPEERSGRAQGRA
jgi:hypothetical protein